MLAAVQELDLAVRVGITTGEVLVDLAPGAATEGVVGDVVNTASRLQGVAPAGGVVVGEATFRATRRLFDYQELEAVQVKGKADPVPIWRLKGPRGRTGVEPETGTPLVGRQAELRLLEGAWLEAVRTATPRLVTVTGAPGVGKSRLVRELAASLDERPELVTWRQGRCLPYGDGITFWALGEIVKAQAGILESDPPPRSRPSWRRPWPPWSPTRPTPSGSRPASPPCSGWSTPARPGSSARSRSPPGAAWSRRWPPPARWCWWSRTCTGPTRPCWSSSSTSAPRPPGSACWWSSPPARNCSSASPPGAPGSPAPPPSPSPP